MKPAFKHFAYRQMRIPAFSHHFGHHLPFCLIQYCLSDVRRLKLWCRSLVMPWTSEFSGLWGHQNGPDSCGFQPTITMMETA